MSKVASDLIIIIASIILFALATTISIISVLGVVHVISYLSKVIYFSMDFNKDLIASGALFCCVLLSLLGVAWGAIIYFVFSAAFEWVVNKVDLKD